MTFVEDLDYSLSHIRGLFASHVIHHAIRLGIFERLESPLSLDALAAVLSVRRDVLGGVINFLVREGLIEPTTAGFKVTAHGRAVQRCAGWFVELIGGYGDVVRGLDALLVAGPGAVPRDSYHVALGSGLIDHYDVIPLLKRLLSTANIHPSSVLDLGCGTGTCLIELCETYEGLAAVGVEPMVETTREAARQAALAGVTDRIRFVAQDAYSWVRDTQEPHSTEKFDTILMAFLLHEIYYQRGYEGLEAFLLAIARRWPMARLLIVEVDRRDDAELLRRPVGAYYHCYYLVHQLTPQSLQPIRFWDELFHRVGMRIVVKQEVDSSVDPTGLEVGYLLEPMETVS